MSRLLNTITAPLDQGDPDVISKYGKKACRDEPEDLGPLANWEQQFKEIHSTLDESVFRLGTFTPKGSSDKVDTLKFVVSHLDRTAAPGTSGWSYDTLRRLENVDFLRPVIDLFFETDADSKFDDSDPYQHRIHEALISCRGLALNKADPKEPI